MFFSIKLSFHAAVRNLSGKAKNAVIGVLSILYRLESHALGLCVKLFDFQIQPILLYGAEVWGVYGSLAYVEKVQSFALKRFLGVDQRALNDMVLFDTGRYPLEISCYICALRYCLKIIRVNSNCLQRNARHMPMKFYEQDKSTGATGIRLLLFAHGFGFVWGKSGCPVDCRFLIGV